MSKETIVKTVERTTEYGTIEVPIAWTSNSSGPPELMHMRINVDKLAQLAEKIRSANGHEKTFAGGAIHVFFVGGRVQLDPETDPGAKSPGE